MPDRDRSAADSLPPLRDRALAELGSGDGTPLTIGGRDTRELVAEFGSPLYVFDADVARRTLARVRAALGANLEVLYALKANPSVALTRVLVEAGAAGVEVASAGEIEVATRAGVARDAIRFAGPGKGTRDLDAALAGSGLGSIHVESVSEYELLVERIGTRPVAKPRVAIRVNPGTALAGARLRMAKPHSKFGVDRADVAALARRIVDEGVATWTGLHVYAATQAFDADAWVAGAADLLELARDLEQDVGTSVDEVNFGGGFGVACFEGDPELDLDRVGAGLRAQITGDRADRRYFVELGRYLVARCGVYLTRVEHVKRSGGRDVAIVDGGLHHHGAAANVGSLLARSFAVVDAARPRPTDVGTKPWTLGGVLCTPQDELGRDLALPTDLARGDVLAFLVSGAYGLTYSSTRFLGHPGPAEVLVDGGEARVVRRRGRVDDTVADQEW